ncbi:MAG: hypothetical protein CL878_05445 [Dehalococcoidia bacterium]|nr:hypothetical protein [Dehalococcoidia bacterium]
MGARGLSVLPLAILSCLAACSDDGHPPVDAGNPEVVALIDHIDQEEALHPTFIASGYGTVRGVLLENSHLKALVDRGDAAVPHIVERLTSPDGLSHPPTRLILFIALGEIGSPDGIPAILSWIESLPDLDDDEILSPWFPFQHACDALRKLVPDTKLQEDPLDVFFYRKKLVEEVRAKFR